MYCFAESSSVCLFARALGTRARAHKNTNTLTNTRILLAGLPVAALCLFAVISVNQRLAKLNAMYFCFAKYSSVCLFACALRIGACAHKKTNTLTNTCILLADLPVAVLVVYICLCVSLVV